MNTLTKKITTLIFLGVFSVSSLALPGIPKLGGMFGGDKDESESETEPMDLATAQSALERTLRNALGELNEAEYYFAQARGDGEAAAISKRRADILKGEGDIDIKESLDETALSREKGAEFEANAGELSADSKALYVQGLVPYAKGVAETANAANQAQGFVEAMTAEVTSIRNLRKIKELKTTFAPAIAIGKIMPGFFKTLGASTKGVFSFAKAQKLNTKNAEAALPDDF